MPFIGVQPTSVPLTSSDITDGIISTAKVADDAITTAKINVNGAELSIDADGDTSLTADTDDQIDIKVGGSDKVTITTTGLGVGTSTPPVPLASSISSNGGNIVLHRSSESDGDYGGIEFHNHPSSITSYRKGAIYFRSDGSGFGQGTISFCVDGAGDANNVGLSDERLRLFSDGFCIGDQVNSMTRHSHVTGCLITNTSTDGGHSALHCSRPGLGTETQIAFSNGYGVGGSIKTVGNNTTQYNTSSDYRLKENVVTDWDATSRLKKLKPSRFNFKENPDKKTVDGFLAHEVSSIVPEAISGKKDEVDKDNNPIYQGIDQSKLVPLLTKALQEAIEKIEVLEAKVGKLEG